MSHPYPLRVLRSSPLPDGACLGTALLAPYAAHGQSLLTYRAGNADEVLCESVVLTAVSLWLRDLFGELLPPPWPARGADASDALQRPWWRAGLARAFFARPRTQDKGSSSATGCGTNGGDAQGADEAQRSPTQSPEPPEPLLVVWLSRARFERARRGSLTPWQAARALSAPEEAALVGALQAAVLRWNARACAPGEAAAAANCERHAVSFALHVAELSDMPFFPEQVALLMRAGVLVGVHGAGLAGAVFMPPRRGAVLELWHGMENNYHYHNIATMLGHAYHVVHSEGGGAPLPLTELGEQIVRAMEAVDAAAARQRKGREG